MDHREATERFYELVWPLRTAVLRTARFLCGDQTEAEDLAQETMLKAFRKLDTFRAGTDMKAWLITILRNTWIDRLRAMAPSAQDVSLEQIESDPADPHPAFSGGESDRWHNPAEMLNAFSDEQVVGALRTLPRDICWTLLLVAVERFDQNEAAELLGVPVGTIKSRLHRGRAMLRSELLPLAKDLRLIGHEGREDIAS